MTTFVGLKGHVLAVADDHFHSSCLLKTSYISASMTENIIFPVHVRKADGREQALLNYRFLFDGIKTQLFPIFKTPGFQG